MTIATQAFSCSAASATDDEALAGTAPTETDLLFVEVPGPWAARAVAEGRFAENVRTHLSGLDGVRVQLVRRPLGRREPGVRVFAADLAGTPRVTTTVLDHLEQVVDLTATDLEPYAGPLWLVCTNGRRDVCCARTGRPVAAALGERWPDATWETTHLGGHRFAGTLLALPSGITLGRLDPATALEDCSAVAEGRLPTQRVRGRAGLPGRAQVADLHVRDALDLPWLDDVVVEGVAGDTVRLRARGAAYDVTVTETRGEPRRQSCAGLDTKAAPVFTVTGWVRTD